MAAALRVAKAQAAPASSSGISPTVRTALRQFPQKSSIQIRNAVNLNEITPSYRWTPACTIYCSGNRRLESILPGGIMDRSFAELEAIVRDRICRVCSDRTEEGKCGLEEPSACALFRLFPQVAQAIQSVNSNDINDYIRRHPPECLFRLPRTGGRMAACETRHQVQCALDAYLLLVVDAIEEATGKTFDRAGVCPSAIHRCWSESN